MRKLLQSKAGPQPDIAEHICQVVALWAARGHAALLVSLEPAWQKIGKHDMGESIVQDEGWETKEEQTA